MNQIVAVKLESAQKRTQMMLEWRLPIVLRTKLSRDGNYCERDHQ